jgi:exosortase A
MNPISSNLLSRSFILVLFATFVLTFFPVWKALALAWSTSDEYAHGFFIIPLCCYILWRKKENLTKIPVQPSRWGLALIILFLLLYLFSHFAEIITLASFSMILLLVGAVIYLYGFLMFKELIFPLFFLLFMIPIPAQIYSMATLPLQLFVSKTSVCFASHLGVPIYREGNIIQIPDRTLEVVRACSGLRSMISLLTLSAVFGYLTLRSNVLRTVLFFSGVPIAIFVNIIRVMLVVLAFYYLNYDLTIDIVHTIFGLIIFILALITITIMKEILSSWDGSITKE